MNRVSIGLVAITIIGVIILNGGRDLTNDKIFAGVELERRGFIGYDWNVSGEDSVGTPTAASIKKNIFDSMEGQSQPIILLHDSPCSNLTAEVLPEILEKLIAEGYEFRTLQCRKPYLFPW